MLISQALALALLGAVALAACGGHATAARSEPTTAAGSSTSTTVTATSATRGQVTSSPAGPLTTGTTRASTPLAPTPASTIAPSVTAGTAVPWSPTSPDSLVGDSGNPADWPAAQPKPPSLAGAYSTNMMKVIVTLITYEDWVGSHPDPALVRNYMIAGKKSYQGDMKLMTELVRESLHLDPSPSEIDWLDVTVLPKPMRRADGRPIRINGRQVYMPAWVNVVIDEKTEAYLNAQGKAVSHTPGGGRTPFTVSLVQGIDGRWRISSIEKLNPSGGLGSLDR
jgi:hypothetical protein